MAEMHSLVQLATQSALLNGHLSVTARGDGGGWEMEEGRGGETTMDEGRDADTVSGLLYEYCNVP